MVPFRRYVQFAYLLLSHAETVIKDQSTCLSVPALRPLGVLYQLFCQFRVILNSKELDVLIVVITVLGGSEGDLKFNR